jgi:hypothetical protein
MRLIGSDQIRSNHASSFTSPKFRQATIQFKRANCCVCQRMVKSIKPYLHRRFDSWGQRDSSGARTACWWYRDPRGFLIRYVFCNATAFRLLSQPAGFLLFMLTTPQDGCPTPSQLSAPPSAKINLCQTQTALVESSMAKADSSAQ